MTRVCENMIRHLLRRYYVERFACQRRPGGATAGEPMLGGDGPVVGAPEEGNWLPGVKSGPVPSSGTQPVPPLFRRMPGEHLILA